MTDRVITTVRASFCAAHNDARGRIHGHSYVVSASFIAGRDALELQRHLAAAVKVFDHRRLPDELASGEAMIGSLRLNMPTAVRIKVERPVEGIEAEWNA